MEIGLAFLCGERAGDSVSVSALTVAASAAGSAAPFFGRIAEAKGSNDAAIAATQNSAERVYLSRKRGELV